MQLLLLLLLLLALLAPGLLAGFALLLLLIMPAYLMLSSLLTIVLAPQQILAVASDKRTRRAHSCEHATVNVLEEWYGPQPHTAGVATPEGFYIWGTHGIPPEMLLRAAQSGLARMKSGEKHLALHPRCGTSLVVARFVFSLVFLFTLIVTGYLTLTGLLAAFLSAWILGRPMGLLAQRFFTTSPHVAQLYITEVHWAQQPPVGSLGLFFIPGGAFFFRTALG